LGNRRDGTATAVQWEIIIKTGGWNFIQTTGIVCEEIPPAIFRVKKTNADSDTEQSFSVDSKQ